MPLLEAGRLIADSFVQAEETLDGFSLLRRGEELGVVLPPDISPAVLKPHLARLALVVVRLGKHRDGRAFSQARALRESGFTGAIRATGHVLPDQYLFLRRCGVSSVELPEGADIAVWNAALHVIPTAYQPGVMGDAPLSLLRRRLAV